MERLEATLDQGAMVPREEYRLDTAKRLHKSWQKAGVESELVIVSGVGHDSNSKSIREA